MLKSSGKSDKKSIKFSNMEIITNIATALTVALFVLGFNWPWREGYLFDTWGWTIAIQDKWWANPLFLCPYCMSPWYALPVAVVTGVWYLPFIALGWVVVLKGTK
jgi:hypothetical protein